MFYFFFNDTATTEIYTFSLHDALPISASPFRGRGRTWRTASALSAAPPRTVRKATTPGAGGRGSGSGWPRTDSTARSPRSEEHTSELQSRQYLVCRLLLEKKKT